MCCLISIVIQEVQYQIKKRPRNEAVAGLHYLQYLSFSELDLEGSATSAKETESYLFCTVSQHTIASLLSYTGVTNPLAVCLQRLLQR